MPDDHSIVVAHCDSGTELLAVCRFKISLRCHKDIGSRIELEELGSPLLRQVIGNYKEAFLGNAKTFALHSCSYHLIGLTASHYMGKQDIIPIKLMGYRIFLVWAKLYFRIHSRKSQMAAVVFPGTDGIETVIINPAQLLPPFLVPEDPVLKCFLDRILFLGCQHCFFFIQHTDFISFCIQLCIIDPDIF